MSFVSSFNNESFYQTYSDTVTANIPARSAVLYPRLPSFRPYHARRFHLSPESLPAILSKNPGTEAASFLPFQITAQKDNWRW